MKRMRFFALLVVFALALSALASCNVKPEEVTAQALIEKADAALLAGKYVVDIDMKYTTNDKELSSVFSSINSTDIEMQVDGSNARLSMLMNDDISLSKFDMTYTILGETMYLKAVVSVLGNAQSMKYQSTLTAEDKKEFIGESLMTGDISASDFADTTLTKDEDTYIIICNSLNEESTKKLEDLMVSQLGADMEATLSNVQYTVEIEDGKYDSSTLSFDCLYKFGSESYSVSVEIEMDYDYDEEFTITAPNDASSYEEIDFEDLGILG